MKIVQLVVTPPREEIVDINLINTKRLYLVTSSIGEKPLGIISNTYGNTDTYVVKCIDTTFTIGNFWHVKTTFYILIRWLVEQKYRILEFDNMRELMQYCIDHGI